MSQRIYIIRPRPAKCEGATASESAATPPRLVRAHNQAAALRHVAAAQYAVEVASQDDIVDAMASGVQPETAGRDD